MTHEVWILMLGLNLDLWTQPLIEKAVSSFGRLMIWKEDHFFMSRAVVKVRVSSLEDIPWFFVFTEGVHFETDSWSVQCEILQDTVLGAAPQDEGFPADDDDFDPNNFHFHGFGQPGHGHPPPPPVFPPVVPNLENLQAMGWEDWPEEQAPNLVHLQQDQDQVQDILPAVEEVVQAPVLFAPEPPQQLAEHVLAMDDLTNSSEDDPEMPLSLMIWKSKCRYQTSQISRIWRPLMLKKYSWRSSCTLMTWRQTNLLVSTV